MGQAQSAQEAAEAKAAQEVHAAESEAAEARAEEKKEEARDTQFIRFLDKKTAKKVEAAKSEAAQAESSKNNEKRKVSDTEEANDGRIDDDCSLNGRRVPPHGSVGSEDSTGKGLQRKGV